MSLNSFLILGWLCASYVGALCVPSRYDPLLYTRWASKLGKVRQKQTKIWAKWERKARKVHILWTIMYELG